jgi:hypothetical protein
MGAENYSLVAHPMDLVAKRRFLTIGFVFLLVKRRKGCAGVG